MAFFCFLLSIPMTLGHACSQLLNYVGIVLHEVPTYIHARQLCIVELLDMYLVLYIGEVIDQSSLGLFARMCPCYFAEVIYKLISKYVYVHENWLLSLAVAC